MEIEHTSSTHVLSRFVKMRESTLYASNTLEFSLDVSQKLFRMAAPDVFKSSSSGIKVGLRKVGENNLVFDES
jgi:hypothetical protein